jgi:hypothetical protein
LAFRASVYRRGCKPLFFMPVRQMFQIDIRDFRQRGDGFA